MKPAAQTKTRLTLVNYGSGNVRSVAKALETASRLCVHVTSQPKDIACASHLVVPGQGAFGQCRAGLLAVPGLTEALNKAVLYHRVPYLGICVGMQLMLDQGLEEGEHAGFGWISGIVDRLKPSDKDLKIPHIGWNTLTVENAHPVLDDAHGKDVYFCHSYTAQQVQAPLATTFYGGHHVAALGCDNMIGVQFHPEKSQKVGLNILTAFATWQP